MVPIEVVAVIDAACCFEGAKDRTKKVNEILREWAVAEARMATLIVSTMRGNPPLLDDGPQGAE